MGAPPIPFWLLERLHRGELPQAQADALHARLAERGELHLLERLAQDDRTTLDAHPPGPALAEIRRRAAGHEPGAASRLPRQLFFVLPIAAAAALSLVLLLPQAPPPGLEAPEVILEKGLQPQLRLYRKLGDVAERLPEGAGAAPGDLLQLGVLAAGRPFAAVLSIDGRGAVTLHAPERAELAPRFDPSGEIALPRAYELDDAPRFERFFLVTSRQSFPVAAVLRAAEALAARGAAAVDEPLALPEALEQHAVLVRKETP